MKKFIIFIIFIVFCTIFLSILTIPKEKYEVIKVVEGDKFYIDLNKNKIAEVDELFHLKDVNAFPLRYNEKTQFYADKFELTIPNIFELGYLGKEFTEKMLLNKEIEFIEKPEEYNPKFEYRFASILFNQKDYAETLLENGMGFAYWKDSGLKYIQFENREKIKENLKLVSDLKLKVLNNGNNEYYELDDKDAFFIKNPEFLPENLIDKSKFKKHKKNVGKNEIFKKPKNTNAKTGLRRDK